MQRMIWCWLHVIVLLSEYIWPSDSCHIPGKGLLHLHSRYADEKEWPGRGFYSFGFNTLGHFLSGSLAHGDSAWSAWWWQLSADGWLLFLGVNQHLVDELTYTYYFCCNFRLLSRSWATSEQFQYPFHVKISWWTQRLYMLIHRFKIAFWQHSHCKFSRSRQWGTSCSHEELKKKKSTQNQGFNRALSRRKSCQSFFFFF